MTRSVEQMTEAEYLAAIAREPDDLALRAVWADALQITNNPRGELIALQLAGMPIDDHLSTHAGSLLGPLAPHRRVHDRSKAEAFTWKRGFIHRARLSINGHTASRMLRAVTARQRRPRATTACNEDIAADQSLLRPRTSLDEAAR